MYVWNYFVLHGMRSNNGNIERTIIFYTMARKLVAEGSDITM
jgi:hypothetical protein